MWAQAKEATMRADEAELGMKEVARRDRDAINLYCSLAASLRHLPKGDGMQQRQRLSK